MQSAGKYVTRAKRGKICNGCHDNKESSGSVVIGRLGVWADRGWSNGIIMFYFTKQCYNCSLE